MTVESADHLRKSVPIYRRFYDRIKKKRGHNVAKVASARKLAELVWVLVTRNQEFIYARPKRTDDDSTELAEDKRVLVKQMARSKSNLSLDKKPTNRILYGTNLRGTLVRNEIQRRGSDEAARIKDLLALGKHLSQVSPSGFDPNRPNFTDWHRLLEIVAHDYSVELARSSPTSKEVTAAV